MPTEKDELHHEYTGEDVNGQNLMDEILNPDVYRITMDGERSPSIGFCEVLYKDFGFALESCKPVEIIETSGKVHNVMRTIFVREEKE